MFGLTPQARSRLRVLGDWAATVQAASSAENTTHNPMKPRGDGSVLRESHFAAHSLSFRNMTKAFDFRIPTRGTKVPHTPDWLREIKYDGYRPRVERDGNRVCLIARNGYDCAKRYPWIVEAALKNRVKQFVIDGEAVILGVDGVPDFNALQMARCSSMPSTSWHSMVTTWRDLTR